MSKLRLSVLLAAAVAASFHLVGCGAASQDAPAEKASAMDYTGNIRVDGQAAGRADVVLLDEHGGWIHSAPVEGGQFRIAGEGVDKMLVRLYEPVVGIMVRDVSGPGDYDFDVAPEDIATVRGTIELPDDIAFDWVELHVNPVAIASLPQQAIVEPEKSFFVTHELDAPEFTLRVLRSSYYVWASRFVDGPATFDGPRNLDNDTFSATGDISAKPAFRGAEVTVGGNGTLAIRMKAQQD